MAWGKARCLQVFEFREKQKLKPCQIAVGAFSFVVGDESPKGKPVLHHFLDISEIKFQNEALIVQFVNKEPLGLKVKRESRLGGLKMFGFLS
jgi:hypothetical protein